MHSCPLGPTELFGHGLRYVLLPDPAASLRTATERVEKVWAGVRSLAESRLHEEHANPRPHTLGTVALAPRKHPAEREVVTGGQYLEVAWALLAVVRDIAADHPAAWPRDPAPRAGADGSLPFRSDGHGRPDHTVLDTHTVLTEQITHWLRGPRRAQRLTALTRTVREHLKVTVVDLHPGPGGSTLETRKGPPADRVRDLLLSAAEEQDADTVRLYATRWAPFDHGHWRQGGEEHPHVDEFLRIWLTTYLGETVRPERVVEEFDALLRGKDASDVLQKIAVDAAVHRSMRAMPETCFEGGFGHRVVDVCGAAAVLPLQLWLMRPGPRQVPARQREVALRALESWVVRRTLCGAPIGALEELVVELLREVGKAAPERAGEVVADHLAAQRDASREWIDDPRLRAFLSTAPLAVDLPVPRSRMLLESLENAMRSPLREEPPCPDGLAVEYVMPPQWREHWGDDVLGDPEAVRRRDAHVHTLGNLTLVPKRLAGVGTNRPWIAVGRFRSGTWQTGKRDLLLEQNHLHLNARMAPPDQETWTEKDIARRTSLLTHHVVRLWPGPDSRPGPATRASFSTGPETLRADQQEGYQKLWRWLGEQPGDRVVMGFDQVEEITGVALPQAAYESSMHWFGCPDNTLARALRDGGWRAGDVDVLGESVCFVRAAEERP